MTIKPIVLGIAACCGVYFASAGLAQATEGEEELSAAEIALQQKKRDKDASRFEGFCEEMILIGQEPHRSDFIENLGTKTCAEVADDIRNGVTP